MISMKNDWQRILGLSKRSASLRCLTNRIYEPLVCLLVHSLVAAQIGLAWTGSLTASRPSDAASTVRGTRPVRQRSTRRWIFRRPPRCPWQEPSRDRQSDCPLRWKPGQPEGQSCRLVPNGPTEVFSSGDNHGRTIPLIVPTLGSGFVTDPDELASHSHPIRIKLNRLASPV